MIIKIIEQLRTEWPAYFSLQPKTAQERKNVIKIQRLKRDAANEIERLREWIKSTGENTFICTYNILKEICDDCNCGRKK